MAEGTAMGADDHGTLVVPRDEPDGDAEAVDGGDPAAGAEPEQPVAGGGWDRWRDRLAIGLTLLPLVVAAFVVVFQMHGDFYPTGDHALIELQARDVGRHPVLFGLFSRSDWAHPGPMFAYLSAPVYRLLGEASVSLNLLALLINGGSLAGMALIARRLAGTPAMLATLLAQALMMRTLGAEFLRDTWNPYITILPFGAHGVPHLGHAVPPPVGAAGRRVRGDLSRPGPRRVRGARPPAARAGRRRARRRRVAARTGQRVPRPATETATGPTRPMTGAGCGRR